MKNYTTEQIRNVVLLGGTRSGKTTLAEAMLYEGKVIDDNRIGEAEIKGIPFALPMAVSMMLDACKKKGEA